MRPDAAYCRKSFSYERDHSLTTFEAARMRIMDASSFNPYLPPTAPLVDPAVERSGVLAQRGRRVSAYILDWLIVAGAVGLPTALLSSAQAEVVLWVVGAIWLVITSYLLKVRGQTIGKLVLGIHIVRYSGQRAGLFRLLVLRTLFGQGIYLIPQFGLLILLIDVLLLLSTSRRTIHDRIADTIVVNA